MMISDAASRALDVIAARERDVMQAYAPGAFPERGDVVKPAQANFNLDPLSVSAPPDAYFVARGESGATLFTRDGGFSISNGVLVDDSGRPVLGYIDENTPLEPLLVDAVDAALGYAGGAQIEPDGTLSYERTVVDPRTGARDAERVAIGRLALARFAAGTKLQQVDPQHAAAPPGILPHMGRAGEQGFANVTPFSRESSRVDLDLGLQRLQEAYSALDAIRAANVAHGSVEKTTMDLLK